MGKRAAKQSAKLPTISEAKFTDQVIDLAKLCGWHVVHFRPAKTAKGYRTALQGHAGFPDICAAKAGRVLFAELKVGRNKPTDEQARWLAALDGDAETYVWYPQHWGTIRGIFQEGWRPDGVSD